MLVSSKKTIFNLHNWQVHHVYDNTVYKDNFDRKGYFLPVLGFDLEKFPFIVVSGQNDIKLINVNTDYIEPLIKTKATVTYGQEPFFFIKSDFGMTLNFTTGRRLFNGNKRLEWVAMSLKPQFSQTLEMLGVLPISNVKDVIEM